MAGLLETDITNHPTTPQEYIHFGKVGDKGYLRGLPPGEAGYSVLLTRFEPTEEEHTIEAALTPLFPKPTGKSREKSWTILGDGTIRLEDQNALRTAQREAIGRDEPYTISVPSRMIPPSALRSEEYPPFVVPAVKNIIGIEYKTHEYTGTGFDIFANIPTMIRFYHGWDTDESFHGPVNELMVLETGAMTRDELDQFLAKVTERKWTPPFKTARQMLIFPFPQERTTRSTYGIIAGAIRPTAPLCSEIIKKAPEADEGIHGTEFRKIVGALGILDPIGTAEDIFYVFERFAMPGDAIMPDTMATVRAFRRLGIDRSFIARILYQCILDLKNDVNPHLEDGQQFLDMQRAKDLVCYYAGSATDDESFSKFLAGTR